MEVNIPRCDELSFEGLRSVLIQMSDRVNETYKQQQELQAYVKTELDKRLTLEETLRAFSPTKTPVNVDVNTVNWLLQEMSSTIFSKLDFISEMNSKNDSQLEKLFTLLHSSATIMKNRFDSSIKLSVRALKYSMKNKLHTIKQNKLKMMIQGWKKHVQNKKTAKILLKERLKRIHNDPQADFFSLWRKRTTEAKASSFNDYSADIKKLTHSLQEIEISYSLFSIKTLQLDKASAKDVEEIKETATKSDIRVLFQDIKNIITTYTGNIKSNYDTQINGIREQMDFMGNEINNRAASRFAKELSDKLNKLSFAMADLNKQNLFMREQLVKVDQTSAIEETDFKVSMLEKKLLAFESKLSQEQEEKQVENSYSRAMKSVLSPRRMSVTSERDFEKPSVTTPSKFRYRNFLIRNKKK